MNSLRRCTRKLSSDGALISEFTSCIVACSSALRELELELAVGPVPAPEPVPEPAPESNACVEVRGPDCCCATLLVGVALEADMS